MASLKDTNSYTLEDISRNVTKGFLPVDGKQTGNIGPPLLAMIARFPEAESLRKQIWDATIRNPDTRMPPFGRHGILSSKEIDLIVQYLYTL